MIYINSIEGKGGKEEECGREGVGLLYVDVYSYSGVTPAKGRFLRARTIYALYYMENLSTQG